MREILKNKLFTRKMILLLTDIIIIQAASFLALYIRFDFDYSRIAGVYFQVINEYDLLNTLLIVSVLAITKLYNSMWSYASVEELFNILISGVCIFIIQVIGGYVFELQMPRSYPFLFTFVLLIGITASRFSYRFLRFVRNRYSHNTGNNVMIIGAGAAGIIIANEITNSDKVKYNLKCVIDDDIKKHGKRIAGATVIGGRDKIIEAVYKNNIEEIIIAMPSVDVINKRTIVEICKETECKLRIVPGIYQLVNGDVQISKLRNVQIEDLLGRDVIDIKDECFGHYLKNKTILITGGGGSIGSELARQIAKNRPKRLVIVDIYENNAYDIEQELKRKYPELDLVVLIASVRNTNRMDSIFKEYNPEIVYHAAAHKHVPLMENSPNEAIKNNVFGTYNTATAAANNGVKKFVLISTDKAVNPTNIMGASKRMCEMVIQMMEKLHPKTSFVAVRFGNVLGSNGSVIPLFKKQIEHGGPITVTHPDIIRYFMTIPEAVSLVIEAGNMAKGGEIFVLDMGEPVKILDLAKNMIKLSGYKEDEIGIEFSGLRPGEKLYEELLMSEEGLDSTDNKLIHIGKPIDFDIDKFREKLKDLHHAAHNDSLEIRKMVKEIVPTYRPKGENNE